MEGRGRGWVGGVTSPHPSQTGEQMARVAMAMRSKRYPSRAKKKRRAPGRVIVQLIGAFRTHPPARLGGAFRMHPLADSAAADVKERL